MSPSVHARVPSSSPSARPTLSGALTYPPILSRLLTYLDWHAAHVLLDTSRLFRGLFRHPVLRDLILARFVPGYGASRDPAVNPGVLVSINIFHLHLFVISQSYPIHLYPTHALRSLFSLLPLDSDSEPLISLTQAHSRFVLLIQSLVHSSPTRKFLPEPSHTHLFDKLSPTLPELTSPAPLSYVPSSPPVASLSPQRLPRRQSGFKSKHKLPSGPIRRLALFSTRPPTPPAPAAEPHSLRVYSSSWRRSVPPRYSSEFDSDLVPPRRRYVPGTASPNSNSQSSLSRSSTPTLPTSNSSHSPPPTGSRSPIYTPAPHDFAHASSPTRAPVLRVYVPCSSTTSNPQTIIRCEEQLVNAGLWPHLSTGDIVVNLGHVPLSNQSETDTSPNSSYDHRRSYTRPPPITNWLVFNGSILVPFSGTPIPVPDALTLPSPFYYTHILPRLANPVFTLHRMPQYATSSFPNISHAWAAPRADPSMAADIQMRLVHLPTRVATAHANGAALVRRYKWLARVYVHGPAIGDAEPELELGVGWEGEWILENDGTKEGKEVLIDWLVGRGAALGKGKGEELEGEQRDWDWELVRERCGKGRIWLKLLSARKSEEVDDTESLLSAEAIGL